MIAELHGKISSSGSNLTDHLEDNLTGDIFGTLRYIPFCEGMLSLLQSAHCTELKKLLENCQISYWADKISFWPYHEDGELDALIELDNAVIGIEVKYNSGESNNNDVDNSGKENQAEYVGRKRQLSREVGIVAKMAGKNKQAFLILIAREPACIKIYGDVVKRKNIPSTVFLGYLSWQEILIQLKMKDANDRFHAIMFEDMIALLKRKGFERFQNFILDDSVSIRPDVFFSYRYHSKKAVGFNYIVTIDKGDYYEYR